MNPTINPAMTWGLILLGGAIGAPARYLIDRSVNRRSPIHPFPETFPRGTFIVNIAGSLLAGLTLAVVSTSTGSAWIVTFIGTGFCGAFTTYSTFTIETIHLIEEGKLPIAASYLVLSISAGLLACSTGWIVGIGIGSVVG